MQALLFRENVRESANAVPRELAGISKGFGDMDAGLSGEQLLYETGVRSGMDCRCLKPACKVWGADTPRIVNPWKNHGSGASVDVHARTYTLLWQQRPGESSRRLNRKQQQIKQT